MEDIVVAFTFKGKEYKGILSQVMGAGSSGMYHLTVDGYHWGKLWYVEGNPGFKGGLQAVPAECRFASNVHPELSELADYFGSVIELA